MIKPFSPFSVKNRSALQLNPQVTMHQTSTPPISNPPVTDPDTAESLRSRQFLLLRTAQNGFISRDQQAQLAHLGATTADFVRIAESRGRLLGGAISYSKELDSSTFRRADVDAILRRDAPWSDLSKHDKAIIVLVKRFIDEGFELICADHIKGILKREIPTCRCTSACTDGADLRLMQDIRRTGKIPDIILKKDGKNILVEVENKEDENSPVTREQLAAFSEYQSHRGQNTKFAVFWVS